MRSDDGHYLNLNFLNGRMLWTEQGVRSGCDCTLHGRTAWHAMWATTEELTMSRTTYHVTPSGEDWKVKRAGAQRADSIHENKSDAITRAKELAKAADLGQVKIHGTIARFRPSTRITRIRARRRDRRAVR